MTIPETEEDDLDLVTAEGYMQKRGLDPDRAKEAWVDEVLEAVRTERERCAAIVEAHDDTLWRHNSRKVVLDKIRLIGTREGARGHRKA